MAPWCRLRSELILYAELQYEGEKCGDTLVLIKRLNKPQGN